MTPRDRVQRYGLIAAMALVAVWVLLCFLVLLSPKLRALGKVNGDLTAQQKELSQMRREIEDARIAGGPVAGGARFEKFGILSRDEEQLFLTDLIAFCKETNNTLNLVRRSEYSRRAPSTTAEAEATPGSQPQTPAKTEGEPGQPPQPVIERVPHTVTFSGTFLSSFYLLRKLESYKRLLTVERADLVTDTRVGYPRLSGNITVDLYLVRTPVPPAGVQPAAGGASASGASATVAKAGGSGAPTSGGSASD